MCFLVFCVCCNLVSIFTSPNKKDKETLLRGRDRRELSAAKCIVERESRLEAPSTILKNSPEASIQLSNSGLALSPSACIPFLLVPRASLFISQACHYAHYFSRAVIDIDKQVLLKQSPVEANFFVVTLSLPTFISDALGKDKFPKKIFFCLNRGKVKWKTTKGIIIIKIAFCLRSFVNLIIERLIGHDAKQNLYGEFIDCSKGFNLW